MQKILIKFLSAFIPVQSWRKAFRRKMNRQALFGDLSAVFTEIKAKRDIVLEHRDSAKMIVLGSSHGAYGLNPEFVGENCFNLCSNSQDLYTAEQVLKYLKEKLPKLTRVIIFLDVFSKGWCLERTSAEHICASYQYLYGIRYPLFKDTKHYLKKCKKLDKEPMIVPQNKNGYLKPPKLNLTDSVESRVQAHLREHNRELSQYEYLKNIIKLNGYLNKKGGGITLLIPPVRNDYQKRLPQDLLLSDAKQLTAKTNVQILDFSNDKDFKDEDFYDSDHLNPEGAKKLSQKIKKCYKIFVKARH